ncbi:MAG: adenosylcobinamide-GDP ribazoletransferase [Chloroflexi bacterium]|jgi:adenosylcobinamide-GDP ribazoletransferase|nr:adenosylcobinamide-GDP ribazoletransferase [Chloroflexota bacterium]
MPPRVPIRWRVQAVGLAAALQFLTVAPPIVRRPFADDELGAAVGWFPVVGLLIGLLLTGARTALQLLGSPLLSAAMTLAIWVVLTGALHLDGLLDACDGLFGGHTPDRRLEIMRDHHIGAFALAGGVLLLLAKFAALSEPNPWRLFALVPALARGGLSLAVITQPYARPQGTGAALKRHAGAPQAWLAILTTAALALGLTGWRGFAMLLATGLVQLAVVRLARAKVGGLTGDLYGAIVELGELTALLGATLLG